MGRGVALAQSQPAASADNEGIRALLLRIEQLLQREDRSAYRALLSPTAESERAEEFMSTELIPGATRVVIQERERQPFSGASAGSGYHLLVDTFIEYGNRARAATWQLAIERHGDEWRISEQERLSSVDSLYRLTVDRTKQFQARDFTVKAEDLELTLADGFVFLVNADKQTTGLVLIGRGTMRFRPTPETEQAQVKIFAGSETLETTFSAAYIRTADINLHADRSQLVEMAVNPRELRRAENIFEEESVKTYVLDLGDLSRSSWSLLPAYGDFLAEVRTRRFSTLTYVHSGAEAEDIFVMDRSRDLNISVYSSQRRLAARGRFYDENAFDDYDVLNYDVDIDFSADRLWIEGTTRLRVRARRTIVGQLNVKLADSFALRGVFSEEYGRLFSIRARGMNVIVVHVPESIEEATEFTLTVAYAGRLEPQPPNREGLSPEWNEGEQQEFWVTGSSPGEPAYLYSSRSFWYAQSPISNYATATIRITVQDPITVVASGELSSESPILFGGVDGAPIRRHYVFRAERPIRYLSFLASRFQSAGRATVPFDPAEQPTARASAKQLVATISGYGARDVPTFPSVDSLNIRVEANPFQIQRGRELVSPAGEIAKFYQSIVGDAPYSSFTLAVTEHDRPGGHSPAHFATLNQPLPDSTMFWRNDPVDFNGYPEFYLAHEVAHQWWGQGVGWNNYHEQWLSEGIAQYFAALYAEHHRGGAALARMLRQMRSWAIDHSDQGPVYLGYRLGHVKEESRIFRALVYNKGATVLHMLRRLLGDDAFFRGVRRFYIEGRYRKNSTETLRLAMEAESGQSLERFFERWIFGATLPNLTIAHRVETSANGPEVAVRIEQTGDLFDVPVAVTLQMADGPDVNILVPVREQTVATRIKLEGRLRSVNINNDDGTLAEIRRVPY
jgi:hypothetical protein